MLDFDPHKTYAAIAKKRDEATNPRHRRMLEQLYNHAYGEVTGNLDMVLGTLAPYPIYKRVRPRDPQPEGMDQVRQFYIEEIFGGGRNFLEGVKTRITFDDDTIITEGPMKLLRWGRDLVESGMTLEDPDAVYLMQVDMLIVWPFDAEQRIIGEESWAHNPRFSKIADEDIPDYFRAYMDGKRQKETA